MESGPCEGDGLDRLVPLQVQMHLDVALKDDEEYAEFTEWLIRHARTTNAAFGDLDPEEFASLPFEVAASAADAAPVRYEGTVEGALSRMRTVLVRGEGSVVAGWETAKLRRSSLRAAVQISTSAYELARGHATGDLTVWFGANVSETAIGRVEEAMLSLLMDAVERWDPWFANLTDDNESGKTALRIAMPLGADPVRYARQQLHGYSWVTYLCPELAAAIGGADKLRELGAFSDVRDLQGGGAVKRPRFSAVPMRGAALG